MWRGSKAGDHLESDTIMPDALNAPLEQTAQASQAGNSLGNLFNHEGKQAEGEIDPVEYYNQPSDGTELNERQDLFDMAEDALIEREAKLDEEGNPILEERPLLPEEYVLASELGLPGELLESDYPFTFSEESRYTDFESLKRGVQEKDQFINTLKEERRQLKEEKRKLLEAREIEKAEMRERANSLFADMDEGEILRRQARAYIPEDLRDFNAEPPSRDQFAVDAETHLDSWLRSKGINPDSFDTDEAFNEAVSPLVDEWNADYLQSAEQGLAEYKAAAIQHESKRGMYEDAERRAVMKLMAQQAEVRAEKKATQMAMIKEAQATQRRIEREVDRLASGMDFDTRNRLDEKLNAPIDEHGTTVMNSLATAAASYGFDVEDIIIAGIKSTFGAGDTAISDEVEVVGSRRPSSRFKSINSGHIDQIVNLPVEGDEDAEQLAREAGFLTDNPHLRN